MQRNHKSLLKKSALCALYQMPLCFVRAVLSQPCLSFAKNLVNNEYKENLFVKKGESLSSRYIYIYNKNK